MGKLRKTIRAMMLLTVLGAQSWWQVTYIGSSALRNHKFN